MLYLFVILILVALLLSFIIRSTWAFGLPVFLLLAMLVWMLLVS